MKTSIIGYPRIGSLRELKFASEKYFKEEITVEELMNTAKALRREHWNTQKKSGINFIRSSADSERHPYKLRAEHRQVFRLIAC